MPTNKMFGMLLGGAVIAAFIFWMAGFVASFWTGLGIAALLLLFFSTSLLTAYKKTAVIVLIITFAILFIRHTTPEPVSNAVVTRAIDTAVRTSATVGKPMAEIERSRLATCKKDITAAQGRYLAPRKRELQDMNSGLISFDAARHDALILEIKNWEGKIEKAADDCMEGLAYKLPAMSEIPQPRTRTGAALLAVVLFLSGWGLYRANPKTAAWTRWIGGPILILAFVYLVYLFFNAGMDKKIEIEIEEWQIRRKESSAPSSVAPESLKEEKKNAQKLAVVTKTAAVKEKRWREATSEEYGLPSTWSVPGMPAQYGTYRRGDVIRLPKGGRGFCGKIQAEYGSLYDKHGGPSFKRVFSCDQDLEVVVASDTARVWKGWCPARESICIVYD